MTTKRHIKQDTINKQIDNVLYYQQYKEQKYGRNGIDDASAS